MQDALVEAARAVHRVAAASAANYMRDQYGPGVFYLLLQDEAAARAFVANPEISERVLYCDRVKCQSLAFPDVTLGAIAAGRANVIVVVDQLEPGIRCTSDSDNAFECRPCKLARLELTQLPEPEEPLPAENTDVVEAKVLELVATGACSPEETLVYVELPSTGSDIDIEFVMPEIFVEAVENAHKTMPASERAVPTSIQTLQNLLTTCQPGDRVIWLRKYGTETDTAWIVHAPQP